MALLARLVSYATNAFGGARPLPETEADAPYLAVVALLVHVARADGVLDPAESERLTRLVRARYAQDDAQAEALIARAAAFDAQTRDMASLVELIGREPGAEAHAERARILTMAWSVAGADGSVHEFEEALVWRLGTLLGLDEAGIAAAREAARAGTEPAPSAP